MTKQKGNGDHSIRTGGLSRRQFMTTVSTGAAAAAVTVSGIQQAKAAEPEMVKAGEMKKIRLKSITVSTSSWRSPDGPCFTFYGKCWR